MRGEQGFGTLNEIEQFANASPNNCVDIKTTTRVKAAFLKRYLLWAPICRSNSRDDRWISACFLPVPFSLHTPNKSFLVLTTLHNNPLYTLNCNHRYPGASSSIPPFTCFALHAKRIMGWGVPFSPLCSRAPLVCTIMHWYAFPVWRLQDLSLSRRFVCRPVPSADFRSEGLIRG